MASSLTPRLVAGSACLLLGSVSAFSQVDEPVAKADAASSPHVTALVAANLPKYEPPKPGEKSADTSASTVSPAAKNKIIRLPDFQQTYRVPSGDDLLSLEGIMSRYEGSATGLDRGYLNRYTLTGFSFKVPLLGRVNLDLLGAMSNEGRAMFYYKEDRRAREIAEIAELLRLSGQKSAPSPR